MDISIGAIGAALVAGLASLLGLIISKEQKTSEFRQQWIDSLRSEITSYLTSFNAICDLLTVDYVDQAEKVAALQGLYSKFNEAGFAITLRINPEEKHSKALIICMSKFNDLAASEAKMVPTNVRPVELDFLAAAKRLLKHEWKRVKRGEFSFVVTKLVAVAMVVVSVICLISSVIENDTSNAKHQIFVGKSMIGEDQVPRLLC